MPRIALNVSDEVARLLHEFAARFNQTPEHIAERVLADFESARNGPPADPQRDAEFRAALNATLEKNAELYQRLARHDTASQTDE